MKPQDAIERFLSCQVNLDNCFICEHKDDCNIYELEETAIIALYKQRELSEFIDRLDPFAEKELIVILSKYKMED